MGYCPHLFQTLHLNKTEKSKNNLIFLYDPAFGYKLWFYAFFLMSFFFLRDQLKMILSQQTSESYSTNRAEINHWSHLR